MSNQGLEIIKNGLQWGFTGILYGVLFNADPIVAATAFAVSAIATNIIGKLGYAVPRALQSSKQTAITSSFICQFGMDVAAIVAFRELKLIADLGTLIFSFSLIWRSLEWIREASNDSYVAKLA
ncbi:MAG: hypothetical protein H0W88_05300 [Parachlamydiaceae bacterium]|nr:hypothetical protein [Parachlamydiaceae bacterium]